MIEITLEAIDKLQTLLYEHAGYAASKNAERILDDLRKQAELRGVTATTIPLVIKMAVSAGDDGLHLSVKDVSWQVLQKVSDKDFGDVDWDPHQPNLPGFERDVTPPKPSVIEAKALPPHDDDDDNDDNDDNDDFKEIDMAAWLSTCHAGQNLIEVCKRNIENIADACAITVLAPIRDDGHHVMTYASGVWKTRVVPNVQEALSAADDGEHIVFDSDGMMTRCTMENLKNNGYGILSVDMGGGIVRFYSYTESGCWKTENTFDNSADGCLAMTNELCEMLANDNCLLMNCVCFCGLK